MSETFDLHDVRHRLKQLVDDGDTKLFENRDGVECPTCGTPFVRLFVIRKTKTSFPENDGSRFCLLHDSAGIHVLRH